jgi:hypothetical protein
MAPVKPEMEEKRFAWVDEVEGFLVGDLEIEDPQAVSEVKGLFNRVVRQDQWDWFTVFEQLGCPGRKKSRDIASGLTRLRNTLVGKSEEDLLAVRDQLVELGAVRNLATFLEPGSTNDRAEKVYILSTREQPKILKIGYTSRPVRTRVNEINSATGVLVPYGVRAVWTVKNGQRVEQIIHKYLAEYRVRNDREFFEMQFGAAFQFINDMLKDHRIEEL